MATNILDQELCTSNVVSLSSEPNSSSFQDSSTDLVSEITAGDSYDLENICPNTNADKNAVVSESVDAWTRSLLDLPAFEYAFINRPTGAHRHKKMGYRLFKENYVKNLRVKPNVLDKSKLFLVKSVCASMKQQSYISPKQMVRLYKPCVLAKVLLEDAANMSQPLCSKYMIFVNLVYCP